MTDDCPHITDERFEAALRGEARLTRQEAVAAYRRGHMTVSRAAELCGVRRSEMEALLIDADVGPNYGPDSVEELHASPGLDPHYTEHALRE